MKKKILVVSACYYPDISNNLEISALRILKKNKIQKISKIKVSGIFEIPVVIAKKIKKYDGFLALGCVIKGKTPHFEFISQTTTDAIMNLSVKNKKPIGNGIITCLNRKQAKARSSFNKKNKGSEAANAVLSILSI